MWRTVTTVAVQELLHIRSSCPCCRDAGEGGHSSAGKLIQPSHSNPLQRASSQRVVTSCRTRSPCAGLGCGRAPMAGAGRGASTAHILLLYLWQGLGLGARSDCSGWHHSHPQPPFSPRTLGAWAKSTSETPRKRFQGPGAKSWLLLPAAWDRKRAGRASLCQHGSSSPLCGAAPAVPCGTVVQALHRRETSPVSPCCWGGAALQALMAVPEQGFGPAQGGTGEMMQSKRVPHLELQVSTAAGTLAGSWILSSAISERRCMGTVLASCF